MTRLRLANEEDIPTLLDMGAENFASSSFAPMTYSREKAGASILHGIRTALVVVSLDDDGHITGCLHGDVIEPWYSSDRMGVELFLYVRPERRGGWAAWLLIKAWVRWCIDSGCVQIRPGTATVCEAADRLYRGSGFEPAGFLYVMNKGQING